MNINGGAELTSGLSDVPVFIASLAMLYAASRCRRTGRTGRDWFNSCVIVPPAVFMGACNHIFRMEERHLRVLWPLTYMLMTFIAGLFWILILQIFRPHGADRRIRTTILCAAAAVSAVNGAQRFFLGYDMTPMFTVFALPAVVHCIWTVIRNRGSVSSDVMKRSAAGVALLLLSVIVEAAMRRPLMLFGIEFGGAFFSHMLIIAAMLMLTDVIRLTSEGNANG